MSGPEYLKKMAFNNFLFNNTWSFWHVLEAISCYQLSSWAHVSSPVMKIIKNFFSDILGTSSAAICHLHPHTFLLLGEQMGDPTSIYLRNLKNSIDAI